MKNILVNVTGIELRLWQTGLVLLAISFITTAFCIALQPGALFDSIDCLLNRPLAFILNWFPVFVTIVLGYLLLGNIFWGASPASLVWLVLAYANLLKMEGREDALVPADLGLIREALSAAASYNLDLHLPMLSFVFLYTAILAALGFFVRSFCPRTVMRLLLSALTVACFVLSMMFVYPSKALYNSFPVPQQYNIPSVFNTLGFNYCFLHNFNLYPIDKPAGYSKSEVEGWMSEGATTDPEQTTSPNIIMVMGEAFSDLSNEDVFDWGSEEANPIYKYNQLAQSNQAVSGHIIVSNISAGTANTEFNVLTGMPTNMISDTTTSSFRVVNKETETIASLLCDSGYSTSFLHPGNSWFYNRSSVYKYFGIEDQTFVEQFEEIKTTADGLVTDEAFLEQLKKEIAGNTSPQFVYSVTIQNHQAYTYEKYENKIDPVPVDIAITDEAMEYLSVYMRGAHDTSEMIYQLAQYIDNLSEPTILVFFGDHLPNLGEDNLTYDQLGLPVGDTDTPDNVLSAYKTPFLIYCNDAYCETGDFQADVKALDLPERILINDIYLGAMVLELTNQTGLDPYFDFLNEARRTLPVFRDRENVYVTSDGIASYAIDDSVYNEIIKKIDWWEYYRLKN